MKDAVTLILASLFSKGILITPDYAFVNAPDIDILVIPSTEANMTSDLKNADCTVWLKEAVAASVAR